MKKQMAVTNQMAVMTIEELQMIEFTREVLRQHGYVVLTQQLGVVVAREKVLTSLDRAEQEQDERKVS
jgi:hypothetical protein